MKKEVKRYETNPFVQDMIVPIKNKQVKISNTLGSDNLTVINNKTGECAGTHVISYRKVDEAEFVKLFTANIAMTFDLKASGIKAFNVLMFAVQHNAIQKDIVLLDKYTLEDFLKVHDKMFSKATFERGLKELEIAQIIAKARQAGFYFINPNFVFNGDRIAFTTAIEKSKPKSINNDKSA